MRAGILAAGLGLRLGDTTLPPKILLRFGGETPIERYAGFLRHCRLPWVEIDFPEDLDEATAEIFPRLVDLPLAERPPDTLRPTGS